MIKIKSPDTPRRVAGILVSTFTNKRHIFNLAEHSVRILAEYGTSAIARQECYDTDPYKTACEFVRKMADDKELSLREISYIIGWYFWLCGAEASAELTKVYEQFQLRGWKQHKMVFPRPLPDYQRSIQKKQDKRATAIEDAMKEYTKAVGLNLPKVKEDLGKSYATIRNWATGKYRCKTKDFEELMERINSIVNHNNETENDNA